MEPSLPFLSNSSEAEGRAGSLARAADSPLGLQPRSSWREKEETVPQSTSAGNERTNQKLNERATDARIALTRMDGLIDEGMDGWMNGWMDGWMDGCMEWINLDTYRVN